MKALEGLLCDCYNQWIVCSTNCITWSIWSRAGIMSFVLQTKLEMHIFVTLFNFSVEQNNLHLTIWDADQSRLQYPTQWTICVNVFIFCWGIKLKDSNISTFSTWLHWSITLRRRYPHSLHHKIFLQIIPLQYLWGEIDTKQFWISCRRSVVHRFSQSGFSRFQAPTSACALIQY